VSDTRWADEWRHLNVRAAGWIDGRDMAGARRLVVEKIGRADENPAIEFVYELQKAVERLEREVQTYIDRLASHKQDLGYLVAEIVKHRNSLARAEQAVMGGELLGDDDLIDRLAAFYNLPNRLKR